MEAKQFMLCGKVGIDLFACWRVRYCSSLFNRSLAVNATTPMSQTNKVTLQSQGGKPNKSITDNHRLDVLDVLDVHHIYHNHHIKTYPENQAYQDIFRKLSTS